MALPLLLAGLHLLALGIGLGAVVVRGVGLRSRLDPRAVKSVLAADAVWGVAALLWIATGLWRLLGGLEKDTGYYLQNHIFLTKMALLLLIIALEVRPMLTMASWRRAVAAGHAPDASTAPRLARISFWQSGLVMVMVFLAVAMARGVGA
jgi:putative membrane protein